VREFATGSTTSSRVMELMSNQASEIFQATAFIKRNHRYAQVHAVVKVTVQKVQPFVPVSLFEGVAVHSTKADVNSFACTYTADAAAFVVFTQQDSLYLVDAFQGMRYFCIDAAPAQYSQ